MILSLKPSEAVDDTLSEIRSKLSRGRHVEADRYAQASARRVPAEHKKAFSALRGEIALGLGKFAAALEWATDTLKGLDQSHRLTRGAEALRIRALMGLGRFREAGNAVESKYVALDGDGVVLSLLRGQVFLHSGRLEEASAAVNDACAKAIDRNDRSHYIESLQLRARVARETGDIAAARADLDRAQRLSNGRRDTGAFAAILSDRADLMAHSGEWAAAASDASQSGRLFARTFSPHEHVSAGRRTGLLSLAQGDPHSAMPSIEKAADVARRGYGTCGCRAEIDLLLADAQLAGRDPEGALERATAALSFFRDSQDPGGLARAHVRRSLAALSASNMTLALREAKIAGSIRGAGPISAGLADLALGRILLRKERERASTHFERASRNRSLYPPLVTVAQLGRALAEGASMESDLVRQSLDRIETFGDRRIMAIVRSDLREMFGAEVLSGALDLRSQGSAQAVAQSFVPEAEDDNAEDVEFLPGLVGKCDAVRTLATLVRRVAGDKVPVSIYGETGTGKENVARAVHDLSPRAAKRFVAINAASLSDELFESTMFGHMKGSFTGAHADQAGFVEDANGGTLFIDEVADLSPRNQIRLLRFLQEGTYRRVGDSRERRADVRIVVAANQRLSDLVKANRFREDLMYRLRGITLSVPALRDRGRDVLLLARHFVATQSKRTKRLSEKAEAEIVAHRWPGNVRELQQEMHLASLLSDTEVVEWSREASAAAASETDSAAHPASDTSLHEALGGFERTFLKSVLARCPERTEAARLLGISRQALHQKVLRFGL